MWEGGWFSFCAEPTQEGLTSLNSLIHKGNIKVNFTGREANNKWCLHSWVDLPHSDKYTFIEQVTVQTKQIYTE